MTQQRSVRLTVATIVVASMAACATGRDGVAAPTAHLSGTCEPVARTGPDYDTQIGPDVVSSSSTVTRRDCPSEVDSPEGQQTERLIREEVVHAAEGRHIGANAALIQEAPGPPAITH